MSCSSISSQLSLFSPQTSLTLAAVPGSLPPLCIPPCIVAALQAGASLCISVSGGKDSQALLNTLAKWHREQGFRGTLVAIHSDLGRAEWGNTSKHVEWMCEQAGVPLIVVQRKRGDLVARLEERIESTQAKAHQSGEVPAPFWPSATNRYCTSHLKSGPIDIELRALNQKEEEGQQAQTEAESIKSPPPFWPSSANRYCTSDLKRGPIDTALRLYDIVISAEGVRADESRERAKKPAVEIRKSITSSKRFASEETQNQVLRLNELTPEEAVQWAQHSLCQGMRLALNWRPLLHWSEADVWRACGTSEADLKRRQMLYRAGNEDAALQGWPCHPAYIYGNRRLSCALCVLADKGDLTNGANHNPDIYLQYLELERRGGATFKHNWSLLELPVSGEAARVREAFLAQFEGGAGPIT